MNTCKNLLIKMNMTIEVVSEEGKGSKFIVTLSVVE